MLILCPYFSNNSQCGEFGLQWYITNNTSTANMPEYKTDIIAHGGYSSEYPENSWAAFVNSIKFKPDVMDMDVLVTVDGVPFCVHPKILTQRFKMFDLSMTSADMMKLSGSDDDTKIPLLADVIDLVQDHVQQINLDIKSPTLIWLAASVETVEKLGLDHDRIIIGARNLHLQQHVNRHFPKLQTVSMPQDPDRFREFFRAGGDIYRLWEEYTTQARIDQIHELGKKVWVTPGQRQPRTVGHVDKPSLKKLVDMGVDGVIVNDLKLATEVIRGT